MDILEILSDETKLKEITQKIAEYKELIKAKGGISKIEQLTNEAVSKAELARELFKKAHDDAESLVVEAQKSADELVKTAMEKADKITYLADEKLKQASEKETSLKKESVSLSKERKRIETDRKALVKAELDLSERVKEAERVESILAQLKP